MRVEKKCRLFISCTTRKLARGKTGDELNLTQVLQPNLLAETMENDQALFVDGDEFCKYNDRLQLEKLLLFDNGEFSVKSKSGFRLCFYFVLRRNFCLC